MIFSGNHIPRGGHKAYVKASLLFLVVLLCVPFVFGSDGCFTNQVCTWYVDGNVGQTSVNISFIYPDGSTEGPYIMDSLGSYIYAYNKTFINTSENVLGCADAINSSGIIQKACESKQIYSNTSEELDMIAVILQPFLLALFGLALVALGRYSNVPAYGIAGGVWFVGLASAVFLGLVVLPFYGGLFFLLLSILLIWDGAGTYLRKAEE